MRSIIKRIEIKGLYGKRDFCVVFENNILILVGENGSGKTTLSRIAFAVLSCNWDMLYTYPFETIILVCDNERIEIPFSAIDSIYRMPRVERANYLLERKGKRSGTAGVISMLFEIKESKKNEQQNDYRVLRMPYEFLLEVADTSEVNALYELTQRITSVFTDRILYLPTYRRIEEQFQNIFPDIDLETLEKSRKSHTQKNVIELVEFGMDDVKTLVESELNRLRSLSQEKQNVLTLGYLGEIVDKTYDKTAEYKRIRELSDEDIKEVLSRIDSSILSEERKSLLLDIINTYKESNKRAQPGHVKILCHYFMQLWTFNNEIKIAESRIREFVEKANKYLVNNEVIYDSDEYLCEVYNLSDFNGSFRERIRFQDLSSGEKQIVSLFSHLYLDKNERVFVFIDEPELSLSVDWQKNFLPDIVNSPNFNGLLATTHSPFVFDNELEKNVHGINEFITKG